MIKQEDIQQAIKDLIIVKSLPMLHGLLNSQLDMAIEALQFQQELVRCKDCGYAYQGLDHYFCHKHNTYKKQGGFCDDGILEEVDGE